MLHEKMLCVAINTKKLSREMDTKRVVKGRKASWSSTTGTNCGAHRVS